MNLDSYRRTVADWYERAPIRIERDVVAWDLLARDTLDHAAAIMRHIDVVPVCNPEPYASAVDMFRDIGRGRMLVSDLNHNHPVWTPEVNRAFRVVHDWCHYLTGSDFSWSGELRAYRHHDSITGGINARHALFTEDVGQVAYALEHGGMFGPQKAAILPQWLFWAVDDVPVTREYQLAS